MLKKTVTLLLTSIMACCINMCVLATENTTQNTFTCKLSSDAQGEDNFYFCAFGKASTYDLEFDTVKRRWKFSDSDYPMVKFDFALPQTDEPVGMRFAAPREGNIKLAGSVILKNAAGNVKVYIIKDGKELWSEELNGEALSKEYELENISIAKDSEIYFKIDSNGSNANDFLYWEPEVVYTDNPYIPESDGLEVFQKDKNGVLTVLYDVDGVYTAKDNKAYISIDRVLPTEEYSFVKRFKVPQEGEGRYRLYGKMNTQDGGDKEIIVYKNAEQVWTQLFPNGEKGILDLRMYLKPGDAVDVEIRSFDGTGEAAFNYKITEFLGTLFCEATTSSGYNFNEEGATTVSLGELLTDKNNCEVFSIKYGQKLPMQFDEANGKWNNSIGDAQAGVQNTKIYPGTKTDTMAEINITQSGIMRIDGNMSVFDAGDGVLSKIYLNDELLWSSRVGGERAVMWNEPFDVSYFSNKINVVANVQSGDKLKLTFNRWRKSVRDCVDISDVNVSYITGSILSDTTKYKLGKSQILDVNKNQFFYKGKKAYMAKSDFEKLFGTGYDETDYVYMISQKYINIEKAVKSLGKTCEVTDYGLIIIHEELPVYFGYAELSEIKTAYKNRSLYSELEGGV